MALQCSKVNQKLSKSKQAVPHIFILLSKTKPKWQNNSSNLRLGGSPPKGSSRLSVQAMVVVGEIRGSFSSVIDQ
jgi:hypothetical protein